MAGTEEKRGVLGKIIAALSVGALIGGITGVLFAPKAGKETREDLAKKAADAEDTIKEKVDELKEKATELQKKAAEVTKSAGDQIGHLQEDLTEISGKVKDGMDEAVDHIKSTVAKGKEMVAERRSGSGTKPAEETGEEIPVDESPAEEEGDS